MRHLLFALSTLFLVSGNVHAADYTFYDISDPKATFSAGSSINDKQEVIGDRFLWHPSTGFQDVDIFGSYSFALKDINNQGNIVGYFGDSTFIRSFIWDRVNPYNPISAPNSINIPLHINDANHVSGLQSFGDFYFWTPEKGMTVFDGFNGKATKINDMNNADLIVGTYEPTSIGSKPFMWDPVNGYRDIPGFTGLFSSANGVNNLGQIVGVSAGQVVIWDSVNGVTPIGISANTIYDLKINDKSQVSGRSSSGAPFLWDPVTGLIDITAATGYPPKDFYNYYNISGLNNLGEFTGFGLVNGRYEAFAVLTAKEITVTPEPMSAALFVLGAAAFGVARRRSRRS